MSHRKQCVFCLRGLPTDADWETNAQLPSECEEAEAERLGLNKLCWEPEDESCLGLLADSPRPLSLGMALLKLAELQSSKDAELERASAAEDDLRLVHESTNDPRIHAITRPYLAKRLTDAADAADEIEGRS